MILYQVSIVFFSLVCVAKSSKILAVFPMPMHSHYTLSVSLVTALVNRNHEVTFVTPFAGKLTHPNLREVSVESVVDILNVQKQKLHKLDEKTVFGSVHFLTNVGLTLTEKVLENENVQNLLHSKEQYDLVMLPQFLNEGLLGIAYHFNAPLILVAPMPLWSWGSFVLSHPAPSSYVPNILTPYTGHMNFCERVWNSIYDIYSILYHQWMILPEHRELVKKYIPGEPDLYNFLNNASLVLINSHVSTYEATPLVPNAIEIGGFHIKEPKKLPEDLKKFLDESKNGVILFSMGSNINTTSLDNSKKEALFKSFSKVKENVLWKWDEDLPEKPKNVKIVKWMPQSDILAHSNVRVFITHGGLFSTMESVYHGVPVVGIPVFSDQKMNMATAVSAGYAVLVPFQQLSEEKLTKALQEVLNNPKYKKMAMKRSRIMQDRPIKPLDYTLYWIEYVIRHQGAPHLRYPGADLTCYQRNLLDVVVFVILILIILLCVTLVSLKKIMNLCKKNRNKIKRQ